MQIFGSRALPRRLRNQPFGDFASHKHTKTEKKRLRGPIWGPTWARKWGPNGPRNGPKSDATLNRILEGTGEEARGGGEAGKGRNPKRTGAPGSSFFAHSKAPPRKTHGRGVKKRLLAEALFPWGPLINRFHRWKEGSSTAPGSRQPRQRGGGSRESCGDRFRRGTIQ